MSQTSSLALFFHLASGRLSDEDGFNQFKHRAKFALRTLLTLPWSGPWLSTLAGDPRLQETLRRYPRLACKLHRPYLHRGLSLAERLQALRDHYQLLAQRLPAPLLEALYRNDDVTLATVSGRNGEAYPLLLKLRHGFDKEGELSLRMVDADGVALATLTFTLTMQANGPALIVGGLQGPRKRHGQEGIKTATRACHGLFPKRLVMDALLRLANSLDMAQVLAVGKDKHIYGSLRYRRDFPADYDAFWETLGATPSACGLHHLPTRIPRKGMEEIASKKRAEYQRRYALLDALEAEVEARLAH